MRVLIQVVEFDSKGETVVLRPDDPTYFEYLRKIIQLRDGEEFDIFLRVRMRPKDEVENLPESEHDSH